MTIGERIKSLRRNIGLNQGKLAQNIGVSLDTVSRWENEKRIPRTEDVTNLAAALNTSVSYLMGETDDPSPANSSRQTDQQPLKEATPNVRFGNICRVPVLSVAQAASCGAGNGLYGVDEGFTDFLFLDPKIFTRLDDLHKPFGIHTEGDSMIGAGLIEGSVAIINPAEEVFSGNIALVVWNDNWFIKWAIWKPNGDVELRSANPNYGSIIVEKEYADNPEWFRVIGKVVSIVNIGTPKSAF